MSDVKFIRKNGRIIPIRSTEAKEKNLRRGAIAAEVVGGVAASAGILGGIGSAILKKTGNLVGSANAKKFGSRAGWAALGTAAVGTAMSSYADYLNYKRAGAKDTAKNMAKQYVKEYGANVLGVGLGLAGSYGALKLAKHLKSVNQVRVMKDVMPNPTNLLKRK